MLQKKLVSEYAEKQSLQAQLHDSQLQIQEARDDLLLFKDTLAKVSRKHE
jgi:hypothetical protein